MAEFRDFIGDRGTPAGGVRVPHHQRGHDGVDGAVPPISTRHRAAGSRSTSPATPYGVSTS